MKFSQQMLATWLLANAFCLALNGFTNKSQHFKVRRSLPPHTHTQLLPKHPIDPGQDTWAQLLYFCICVL